MYTVHCTGFNAGITMQYYHLPLCMLWDNSEFLTLFYIMILRVAVSAAVGGLATLHSGAQ